MLQDNVLAHKGASVCQFFTPKNVTLYHPLYSPDLSPPYYLLFPKLKMQLKGLHFVDVEIKEAIPDELNKVQKEEFLASFQKLYDHARTCIYANGVYFELKKSYVCSSCLQFLKNQS
jgi:hypothetical protein